MSRFVSSGSAPSPRPAVGGWFAPALLVLVVGALAVAALGLRAWSSPREVVSRYVVATAGDVEALDETTGQAGAHASAAGALASVYGVERRGPVEIVEVGPLQREFADVGHMLVRGTADGVPFTTDVSVATGPFSTRVLGEYVDPAD